MMKACLLAGIAALSLAGPANAALVTYSYDLPSPQTIYPPKSIPTIVYSSTEIPEFNPKLGILDSFTFHFVFDLGRPAKIDFVTKSVSSGQIVFSTGNIVNLDKGGYDFSLYDDNAHDLSLFTGIGDIVVGDSVFADVPGSGTDVMTIDPGSTLTYSYTPSALPEPADLALFGLGLLALGLIVSRRRA